MVYVVTTDDSLREKSWDIVRLLRNKGISADFDLKKRNLKKQLEYANSLNIPYVILIGKKELEKGKVKLKDMKKRQELDLSLEDILQKLAYKQE